jgi:hypothetical protein
MKYKIAIHVMLLFASAVMMFSCTQPQQKSETNSANSTVDAINDQFPFEDGYPKQGTADKLLDEMDYQRACQAYIWALPMVGLAEFSKANKEVFHVQNAQLISYITYEEKLGILTPNYTTPYVIGLCNLAESGPLVFDFPQRSSCRHDAG